MDRTSEYFIAKFRSKKFRRVLKNHQRLNQDPLSFCQELCYNVSAEQISFPREHVH
jgi:hypothetical protein